MAWLAVAAARSAGAAPENVRFSGDLRYRFEYTGEEGLAGRQRDRLRARAGAEATVATNVTAVIQAAGGTGEPTSSNQTLTDGFSRKNIWLDLAYVEWRPAPGLAVAGGKLRNPFLCVSDLIWDTDVNPEGVAAQGRYGLGPTELRANAGYLWVVERTDQSDSAKLYAGQLAGRRSFGDKVSVTVGASCYLFANMEGFPLIDASNSGRSYGNSFRNVIVGGATNRVYAGGFNLAEGFAEVGFSAGLPARLYAQCVVNADADQDQTGYLVGVGLGRAKERGSCELGYEYARIGKDGVPGCFTDADRWGGGTDGRGHKVTLKYQLMQNDQAAAAGFMDTRAISDPARTHDFNRFQFDITAKF